MDGREASGSTRGPHDGRSWDDLARDEHDTPAEVDANFRTQRRIAVGYFLLFLAVTIAVPTLTLVLDWWSRGRLLGGMSPNFVMAAVGLYVIFFLLGVAAATLATAVEEHMLGGPTWPSLDDWDDRSELDGPSAPVDDPRDEAR